MYEWFTLLLDIKQLVWMVFSTSYPYHEIDKVYLFWHGAYSEKKHMCLRLAD